MWHRLDFTYLFECWPHLRLFIKKSSYDITTTEMTTTLVNHYKSESGVDFSINLKLDKLR